MEVPTAIDRIKNFWNPELKKERVARKEEMSKFNQLYEKYRLLVSSTASEANAAPGAVSPDNKLAKENSLLKKTLCELEMRIETQKQNLNTKDETIKSLLILINANKEQNTQQQQHDIPKVIFKKLKNFWCNVLIKFLN